jgi:hypothetical protein
MGLTVDNFPNEPAYNNTNSNPLYQFSILNFPGIAPGTTFSISPLKFYDYYAPTIVNDYMVCVGGATNFNASFAPSINSSSSMVGLYLSTP